MRSLLPQIALYGAIFLAVIGALALGAPKVGVLVGAVVVFVPLAVLADRWTGAGDAASAPAVPYTNALWKTIGMLSLSLLFCVAGLIPLRQNWRVSVVTLTFFGGCSIVFLDVLRRQLRERRLRSLGIEGVRIIGGVDITLARGRLAAMGLGLTAMGSVLYAAGRDYPWMFRILGLCAAGVGIVLLAALPFLGRRRLRFDPEGLLIGELRFEYRIAWDDIGAVGLLEHANNPFVTLQLRDVEHIAVRPPARHGLFLRTVNTVRAWYGADAAIAASLFGLQAPLLAAAINRYASDPAARRELTERLLEARP